MSESPSAEPDLPDHPGRPGIAVAARALVSFAAAGTLIAVFLPRATHASWSAIGDQVAGLSVKELAGLTLLWALGLLAHSFVLTGALPGLSRRRALTLNLTGSAVSNVVPFGGAVGMAMNLTMVRRWRLREGSFGVFTLITNLWDVMAKLALPLVAVVTLLAAGTVVGPDVAVIAVVAAGTLLVVLAVMVLALTSERVAVMLAGAIERVVRGALRLVRSARTVDLRGPAVEGRRRVAGLIRTSWLQLTVGMGAYVSLQALLLWACLQACGSGLPPAAVLAGFAVERLLTIVVVTPAGAGIAETGAAAVLLSLGGDPVSVATGILLYRTFVFALEIPVGAVWLAAWFMVSGGGAAARNREAVA